MGNYLLVCRVQTRCRFVEDDDGNGYVDDVRGWDFYSNDNNPDDTDGHGTHTAGTVGAVGNNGIGVAGVNWQCKLMPLRFLGPQGGYTSDAILAVEYCATMGVRVSNNSWGGGGFSRGGGFRGGGFGGGGGGGW